MAFSDLLKLLTSAFTTAHFLPCVLASVAGAWALPILVDPNDGLQIARKLQPLATTHKVAAALGIAILLSVAFNILSRSQTRFYEGYVPSRTFWKPLIALQAAKRAKAVEEREALANIPKGKRSKATQRRLDAVARALQTRHARSQELTLATRLGNVFRAFEGYPNDRYNFDGVTMWPRIEPLLPEPARASVASARSNVDLLLTAGTLAWFATALVVWLEPLSTDTLILVATLALLAYLCYRAAVIAALSLGMTVRASFDIGRVELLKAMGMELPNALSDERELWGKMTDFLLFNRGDGGRESVSSEGFAHRIQRLAGPLMIAITVAAAMEAPKLIKRRLRERC